MLSFTGYRRAGKTRSAVRFLYGVFKKNPNTLFFTNTPLNFPSYKNKAARVILFEDLTQLKAFFQHLMEDTEKAYINPSYIFIDEANLVMPSRLFDKLDPSFLAILAESRKIGAEIVFTTQHATRVDKILRELTEDWFQVITVLNFVTIQAQTRINSSNGEVSEILKKKFFFFPSKFNKFYDHKYIVHISSGFRTHLKTKLDKYVQFFEKFAKTLSKKEQIKRFFFKNRVEKEKQ